MAPTNRYLAERNSPIAVVITDPITIGSYVEVMIGKVLRLCSSHERVAAQVTGTVVDRREEGDILTIKRALFALSC